MKNKGKGAFQASTRASELRSELAHKLPASRALMRIGQRPFPA